MDVHPTKNVSIGIDPYPLVGMCFETETALPLKLFAKPCPVSLDFSAVETFSRTLLAGQSFWTSRGIVLHGFQET
jgi:hypothetical protein